jgi:hypothetical protein
VLNATNCSAERAAPKPPFTRTGGFHLPECSREMSDNYIWTPEEEKMMLDLRASGMSWHLIAKKLGRTEVATMSRAGVVKARESNAKNE